jgi:hypothetical protein
MFMERISPCAPMPTRMWAAGAPSHSRKTIACGDASAAEVGA